MWIAQSELEYQLQCAVETGCEMPVNAFPEALLMAEYDQLVRTPLFGDFADLLLKQWHDLDDDEAASNALCLGIRTNTCRDAFIHAVNAIMEVEAVDPKMVAKALDARAADENSSLDIRIEAVTCLTQLALQTPSLKSFAIAGVMRLLDAQDDWVKAKLCRVTSVLYDHLGWEDAIESLQLLTQCEGCAIAAREELGFVEMANAFQASDMSEMIDCFSRSATWFRASADMSENAARARMYAAVTGELARSLHSDLCEGDLLDSLSKDVHTVVRYSAPRAGASWLSPPAEAELEWIPLMAPIQGGMSYDPLLLLTNTLTLFEKVRAVAVTFRGERTFRKPNRIGKLAEKGRLLSMVHSWLSTPASMGLTAKGRHALEQNLACRATSLGKC
ncbi:hypothetical protein [Pseudomonas sp. PNPG3]|uniref:hypothetical protein n=1 Tax=Pseudomonas sp. PNPG3 TaxID=2919497 RepID=UPI001FFC9140|nr:hypothetical protein [Pseudomonas sp. PNPG3]MCK2121156.1 hypothetical protein [Pseudomonas sp. PNPG3]